ncbi:DUF6197 family protein [Jatrophihabitans sp.]|uniref:DUF6197 family protein n=1 Tax=Jatrophihabitans sp. TaxID=1932789 RepID=UPI002BD73985|nr:hypothetical protein [Jatrophihabitans sp.]
MPVSELLRPAPGPLGTGRGLTDRIARRRLADTERRTALRAELHYLQTVLADAATVVEAGWIQHGWFAYRDEQGRQHLLGPHDLHRLAGRQPTGACLVGAVVQAGGGVPAARSQPVHRALDLTWQALVGSTEPAGYCPAPAVRIGRVRELTAWNDRPHRTAGDVTELLAAAGRLAAGQLDRLAPLG